MTVPDDISQIARLDQANEAACSQARTLAAQWVIYRDAGMPEALAVSLVEMFLESVLAVEETECTCPPEENA